MEGNTVELYRQDDDHTPRTIRVSVEAGGDAVLSSQDFPSDALRALAGGAGEYSYDATVPAAAAPRLLLALLVEKYRGDGRAVEDFRDWCAARGIPCEFSTWGSGQFD